MSKYINEEQLKNDTLEIGLNDLEEQTEVLAGRLFILSSKMSEGGSYEDTVKFCEVMLQLKAIETFYDKMRSKEKS